MLHGDGYMTMAQAVGDQPMPGLSFTPGEGFDPSDEDEREVIKLAMERDMHDRMAALERENAALRRALAAGQNDDGQPYEEWEGSEDNA